MCPSSQQDGDVDVLVASQATSGFSFITEYYKNDGAGGLVAAADTCLQTTAQSKTRHRSVALADFDGDGYLGEHAKIRNHV